MFSSKVMLPKQMKLTEILRLSILEYRDGGLTHLLQGSVEKGILRIINKIDSRISTELRWKYFGWRSSNDIMQFKHPPDPFKTIYVDPNNINKVTKRRKPHLNRRIYFGRIKDGNWDQSNLQFKKRPIYCAAIKRFKNNRPWREIAEVQEQIKKVERSQLGTKSHRNKKEVIESYNKFENLFDTIQREGYRTQAKLLDDVQRTDSLYPTELDEVAVDIGRDGELLHADGTHRLTIAKILEIPIIPAVIHVRHKDWMVHREAVAEGRKKDNHPDLNDF